MSADRFEPRTRYATVLAWLARVNAQVSQWAAAMSWGRLIVLFLLVLFAGSIISDLLHLKHDRVSVSSSRKEQPGITIDGSRKQAKVITIGGPNGIRIVKGAPSSEAEQGVSGEPAAAPPQMPASAAASGGITITASDLEDDEDLSVTRQVMTARGILGDLGATVLVVLFAYLAAAKIVVRKVAESDAKVRTAMDAAERETMERQLVQARLQVLQAQVEPHFLFNTLAAVDYLIETDPPRASSMQKALITYLRGALPQMRQETSTLGREMRLIRSYLELIKMRIEDRLEVEIAVPQSLHSAEFPPMMLQSLVENAIKHGIEPKPQGGKVTVGARVQNKLLWVEVRDTGVGLPDGDLFDGPTSGTGIGLHNIRERLAMLYPGKSRLSLQSDDTGTTVKIAVPYQVATESAAAEADMPPGRMPT